MTIQPDTELSSITRLDFAPRCSVVQPCRVHHVTHTCDRPAAASAMFPHEPFVDHAPRVHLLCKVCLALLIKLASGHGRCVCGHVWITVDDFITDVRPLS